MKAYELIEKFGWIQGEFGNETRGFCTVGAIYSAYGHRDPRSDEMNRLREHTGCEWVVGWNDDEQQTKQEVIDTLKLLNL